MVSKAKLRRGVPGLPIESLPYRVRVYINNQVLIPARLVRALGINQARYVDIALVYNGSRIYLRNIRLLRTRHTDSRQFTIPKAVRDSYGISPGDELEIISVTPSSQNFQVP